jgi:uncharacterized membrane protein
MNQVHAGIRKRKMMRFCKSCGNELAVETAFCASCGSPTTPTAGISIAGGVQGAVVAISPAPASPGSQTMATNLVGALTYLAGFITGIIFLMLEPYKGNSFVRFHAYQSILLSAAWVVFWIAWMIMSAILTPLAVSRFRVISSPLMLLLSLVGLGMWVFPMYQAYEQKLFKLPIVGKFAARRAGVKL